MAEEYKICTICKNEFPNTGEYFYKNNGGKSSQPYCKQCVMSKYVEWKKKNIDTKPPINITQEILIKHQERFWKKVDISENENNCWNWKGCITSSGYGSMNVEYRTVSAHSISYILKNGEIPDELIILHSCDNRKCVNPNHLSVGTYSENTIDSVKKGRWVGGKRKPK